MRGLPGDNEQARGMQHFASWICYLKQIQIKTVIGSGTWSQLSVNLR